jgi:hypothetical protein
MSYLGCRDIQGLRLLHDEQAIQYCVLTKAGQDESGYHDIQTF